MLHWNRAYRDLMAHPAVVPILEQLCGARFRLDHINVHTHVAAGYSGSSLHGGSNPGGGNGFYHYQGGQMRNGLVAVTWELEDTHCNGGGFCCVRAPTAAPYYRLPSAGADEPSDAVAGSGQPPGAHQAAFGVGRHVLGARVGVGRRALAVQGARRGWRCHCVSCAELCLAHNEASR